MAGFHCRGGMIGLAAACKYVPLVMVVPFVLAHWHGRNATVERPEGAERAPLLEKGAPALGLLTIAAAMFLATPFTFLDWRRTLVDIGNQSASLFSEWAGQSTFPISLPSYLLVSLPHALGWPAYLASVAGLVLLWRAGSVPRLLAWIPILIVLVNGMLKVPQERYVLPAIPFLCIGSALALSRGIDALGRRAPSLRFLSTPAAIGALVGLCAAWPLRTLLLTRHDLGLPDSRHLSRRWITEHLDPNRPTVFELYGPAFDGREKATVVWPFFATQSQLVRPAYHPELLDGLEYYVASGEISRRFEADPRKYPVETAYYDWLRARAPAVWESDPKTSAGPRIVIRHLPSGISTRSQRDSLIAADLPEPSGVDRLALWCSDCSKLFAQLGDYGRSEEWARHGLRVGSPLREGSLRAELLTALERQGHLGPAEAEAAHDVAVDPLDVPLRLYHGDVLMALKRVDAALAEYRTAFDQSGQDLKIRLKVGRALGELGRLDEAVRELCAIPSGHPARARGLRYAAFYLVQRPERRQEANALLRESLALDPHQAQAELLKRQIAEIDLERRTVVGK